MRFLFVFNPMLSGKISNHLFGKCIWKLCSFTYITQFCRYQLPVADSGLMWIRNSVQDKISRKPSCTIKHSLITQYGPIGMSSPVSTGVLKFRGRGASSAQNRLSALGAPPARSRSGRAAPRFPTLCKKCASFRTTNKQPLGAHQGFTKDTGRSRTQMIEKGDIHKSKRGKIKHSADGQKSHFRCFPGEVNGGTEEQGVKDSWVSEKEEL